MTTSSYHHHHHRHRFNIDSSSSSSTITLTENKPNNHTISNNINNLLSNIQLSSSASYSDCNSRSSTTTNSLSSSSSSTLSSSTLSPLRRNLVKNSSNNTMMQQQQYKNKLKNIDAATSTIIGTSQHSIPDENCRRLLFNITEKNKHDSNNDNNNSVTNIGNASNTSSSTSLININAGNHRLKSLLQENNNTNESNNNDSDNLLSILSIQPLQEEFDAMQQEILRTNIEIQSLEEDYDRISQTIEHFEMLNLNNNVNANANANANANSNNNNSNKSTIKSRNHYANSNSSCSLSPDNNNKISKKDLLSMLAADDYHTLSSSPNTVTSSLDHKTKSKTRKARGLHFRVKIGGDTMHNHHAQTDSNTNQDKKNDHFNEARLSKVAFLSRCGSASRARTVTYVSLIGQAGFFIRRENGKWYVHGDLPTNLQRRLAQQENKGYELRYLSVGPNNSQCYYAEWSSGDCWWVNFDDEFHNIVNEYPVHRIAFGGNNNNNSNNLNNNNITNNSNNRPSWIVISKDGRSAWSGIPSRLANTLKNRDPSLPAPCEVSLGPGGSYFIKFLDGDTDYILPAVVANECEDVERNGGKVTNVSLHMDCYDFIIRHTETSKVKRGEVVIRSGGKGK